MRVDDRLRFSAGALAGNRVRTGLMLLAMAVGVAAVVALTALGEGARRYVVGEFAALGTNLLTILPGRNETRGGAPPVTAETPRDLTIDDALALYRSPAVKKVAPINVGEALASYGGREREAVVLGSTAAFAEVRHLDMARGRFLPGEDPRAARPVGVIGRTIEKELFGTGSALGQWLRLGDRRFRVIGVVAQTGRSLGVDMDELVIIPVASAQQLFDTPSLFRIVVAADERAGVEQARAAVERIIKDRHEGELDVTVITQDSVLAAFDRIFQVLTLTVAGIAGISLIVAGILIMNVMLVAVVQRRPEIGLLKALGAPARLVLVLFLFEAGLLALVGALAGLGTGLAAVWLVRRLFPVLPLAPPWWAVVAAVLVAVVTGLVFALVPAKRAARLDPVRALTGR